MDCVVAKLSPYSLLYIEELPLRERRESSFACVCLRAYHAQAGHSLNVSTMNSIGIMQGRLTPRKGRPIQFFPFDGWRSEFAAAASIGLREIEFIFDAECYEENPLWHKEGREEIRLLIQKSGVVVNTVCADYFMVKPFFRGSKEDIRKGAGILTQLLMYTSETGAHGIELPFVDNSSITTAEEEDAVYAVLTEVLPTAEKYAVWIGLETDFPPERFRKLLKRFDSPYLRANYDTGNSAGLGYDPEEELSAYGMHIGNIHIKDRKLHAATVPLGTGDASFKKFFSALKELGYSGSFILQAARGEDGDEKKEVAGQKEFLIDYLKKYS